MTRGGRAADGRAINAAAARFHSAAIRLLRFARAEDRELGLSASRLSALSVLVFGGPRSLGALADAEQVTSATMSRLVTALERDGLVRREPDPDDARAVIVEATSRGRDLLVEGRDRRVHRLAAVFDRLSTDELETIADAARILERLLERTRPSS